MKKHRLLLAVLFSTIFALLNTTTGPIAASEAPAVNCDPNAGSCKQTISDTQIQLEIDPKPVRAMETLTFRLTVPGLPDVSVPIIKLSMPGMNMGPNSVPLTRLSKDTFVGKGVIVKCRSGKRLWKASVTVPGLGKTDFIFNVDY